MPHSDSQNSADRKTKLETADEKTVDPRDLIYNSETGQHPREVIENPAVAPQMLNDPETSRAGFIRAERGENQDTQ
ncbi:MAG: hypothetical protein HC886_15170 [Leptolyngbyaceae cyanobacterium SM1_1_3]|nr:hypothetical protein [Leptolyngbyaceae cyanobacterium SM1_1_3]NJN03437.1 hypothetical protein [Leptolyngbyaceae cyanobacterium RM1_1_2]NJO08801.1 hypothetical protein [Leptolyngbyaceae cyanobacterium SL_1_1]